MMVLSMVRMFCRQRAVIVALAPPIGLFGAPRVRLARRLSWAPWGPGKTEGKIKGPARAEPLSQSARGLGAARRLAACVSPKNANPQSIRVGGVPLWMRFAALRWSLCRGIS
ncbi:MAG: hypothetical protein Q7K57_07405 [Burkholderiaceae bacterium]|jgi:hypothetical protein|nr:hypothetical protein [Burkholderiaceae bacterium]